MNYFLIGYYGFQNTGDDICLQKTQQIIKKIDLSAKFFILGSSKQFINRFNIFKVIQTICQSDKIVFGGGSICQNVTSTLSLYFYLILIIIASLARKPIYAVAQGIGPINGELNSFITRKVVRCIHSISLRDEFYSSFVNNNSSIITADLAFYNAKCKLYDKYSNIIAVNFCSTKYLDESKQIYQYLLKKNKTIENLSFCKDIDQDIFSQLKSPLSEIKQINYQNYYDNLTYPNSIAITMRYHSCIWAALHGVVFLALAYDEKVELIAKQFQLPFISLYKNEFSINNFSFILNQIQSNLEKYRQTMTKVCKELIINSKKNEDVFVK